MTKKYQVTELDKVVEQVKGFNEWTNEDQLEHQLRFQEESHKKALERMAVKNAELYTDNVLLKREIETLQTQLKKGMSILEEELSQTELLKREIEELKTELSKKNMARICMEDDAETYYSQLKDYKNLQSEVHSDIEKVWMYDSTLTKDLSAYQKRKRSEAIERVFYKIANQWI
jgi:vancomycin resistance protein YoaR